MGDGASGTAGQPAGESSQGPAANVNNSVQPAAEGTTQKADANTVKEANEKVTDKAEETTKTPKEGKADKSETPEEPTEEKSDAEKKEAVKKHKYADRLAKEFPDRKFEKDEDYDSALDEHLTDLEGYKEKGISLNKKLIALFDSEPHVGGLVQDMINGATFRTALARHFSPEEFTSEEGDPDYEAWNENKTKREQSLAERKTKQEARENNLKLSQEAMTNFATENNMDETTAEQFYTKIDEMIGAINSGLITKDALLAMRRAFNYEQDINKAKEEAELAGKNKNIVARKETKPQEGDGLPRPTRTNTETEIRKTEPTYMDGLVNRVNKTKVL